MAVLRQDAPTPVCGVTNVFTGLVVEQALSTSSASAAATASQAAKDTRAPLTDEDLDRACPDECPGGSHHPTSGGGEIHTIEVDPDTGTWVSQWREHWMVTLRCPGDYPPGPPLFGNETEVVRWEEPLECGRVRRSLGTVMCQAYGARSSEARAEAKRISRETRDRLLAEDEAKTCPPPCLREPVVASRTGQRLVIAREVKQARSTSRYWVAYAIAWWSIEHDCRLPEVAKKDDRRRGEELDELEYFDPTGVA